MGRKRQKPAKSGNSSEGGRPPINHLEIDWKSRAEAVWKIHSHLRQTIAALHVVAKRTDPAMIGEYDDFRRKFNGSRLASEAFSAAVFEATQFDRVGISLTLWNGSDKEWQACLASISKLDAFAILAARAELSSMSLQVWSSPPKGVGHMRRLRDGPPAENELRANEYLNLRATLQGSSNPSPVRLLAMEWSETSRDWQIFNLVEQCSLNLSAPLPVAIDERGATVDVPLGVAISGRFETFDLFVLAKHNEFDHLALGYLRKQVRRSELTPLEMAHFVELLLKTGTPPEVGRISYTVVV